MKLKRIQSVLLGLLLLGYSASLMAKDAQEHWVGSWATAPTKDAPTPQAGPRPEFARCTLRQIVHVSVGGRKLRVKVSNAFGTPPLKIGSAHVALSAGGSKIKPGTHKPLTFNGQEAASIPAGAPLV